MSSIPLARRRAIGCRRCLSADTQVEPGGTAKNLRATLGGCDAGRLPYARTEVCLAAPRIRPVGRGVQRMNVCGSACLLGMLASVGLAVEAGAAELGQSTFDQPVLHQPLPQQPLPHQSTATAQSQGFALPSFLDVTRLPDLQAAWREHFGVAEKPAFAAPMGIGARDIAAETDEGSVRARAEALSRRFAVGADGEDASQDEASVTVQPVAAEETLSADTGAAPTETGSIHINNSADVAGTEQALPRANAPDRVDGRSAKQKVSAPPPVRSAAIDNAPVIEDMTTKQDMATRYARRASRSPVPIRRIERPANSPTLLTTIGGLFVGSSETPEPEGATMLPTELRAFGWSSQP